MRTHLLIAETLLWQAEERFLIGMKPQTTAGSNTLKQQEVQHIRALEEDYTHSTRKDGIHTELYPEMLRLFQDADYQKLERTQEQAISEPKRNLLDPENAPAAEEKLT